MILSLLVCLIFFVTVIGIVGVSKIGSQAIGKRGTASYQANTTMWTAATYLGSFSIYLSVVIIASIFLLCGVCWASSKASKVKVNVK